MIGFYWMKRRTHFRIAVLLCALAFMALNIPSTAESKELAFYPDLGGDFSLKSTARTVNLSDYRGKVVLLVFGYTFCPDSCPVVFRHLKMLMTRMGSSASQIRVLLVTIDPARDNTGRLQEYVSYFNADFIGLRGSQEQIAQVAQQYGVTYVKERRNNKTGYFFDHTPTIFVIDPEGRIRALFDAKTSFSELSGAVKQLLP